MKKIKIKLNKFEIKDMENITKTRMGLRFT
jgi:hypothetical protein